MPGLTDELEQAVLNHVFGKATYTPPANWHLGVSTTTPSDDGAGFTEPGDAAYARIETAPADWATASGTSPAQITNDTVQTFATATADWGSIVAAGLFEASTGGTPKVVFSLNTSQTVNTGQVLEFAVGTLKQQVGDLEDVFG